MSQQARNNPDLPPMHSIYPDTPRKYATDPQNKPSMSPANAAQGKLYRVTMPSGEVVTMNEETFRLFESANAETARLRASNEALAKALESLIEAGSRWIGPETGRGDAVLSRALLGARAALAASKGTP